MRLVNPISRTFVAGVVGLLLAAALPAMAGELASDLAVKVPPGSVTSREDIAHARAAAQATEAAAEMAWQADQDRCWQAFFATACRDAARRQHLAARREVRRVVSEAGAVERRLDNQARAEAKAVQQLSAPTPEQVVAREAAARADYEARQQRAREAADDRRQRDLAAEQRRQAHEQRLGEQQLRETQRAAQTATEAQSARQFAQKQAEAQAYAARKAQERAENERRRSERQREREKTLIEQGRAPPVASPSGAGDAAAPKVDLPPDIPPPPALVDDRPEPPKPAPKR
ncbi:MAG: hypothetical protein U5L03_12920 [Burkholderiaceae bacterium]|nr:hypothetical protein [Burkholderiaceae bacterium]